MTSSERDLGMDPKLFSRSIDASACAVEGGRALRRSELGAALTEAGIDWRTTADFSPTWPRPASSPGASAVAR